MSNKKFLDNNGLLYFWQKIVNAFVKKDGNKVLSDNNYTTAEKEKLAGLNNYTLPTASADTLGGIKVGAGLAINEGVLSATGGGTADSVDWANVQNKPTKVSQFTNDSDYQTGDEVSSAISSAIADKVTNSQMTTTISSATKDMATKTYVTQQLANINKKQVVTSEAEMIDANTIYLMTNSGSGDNVYDEYIVVNGKAEKVGTTEVDLTNYVQYNDLVAITNQEIDTIVAS